MNLNDGTSKPPRLEVYQSMTATIGFTPEWSLEKRFEQIALAGFSGVHARLPPLKERPLWRRLCELHNLSFGALIFPTQGSDIKSLLLEAQDFEASYANAQVQGRFLHLEPSVVLLEQILEAEIIPCLIETHRGTVTQDLLRMLEMLVRLPNLNLTLDLSHYVLAGEIGSWVVDSELEAHFEPLLKRTKAIHGRISSGEQIQVGLESRMRVHFLAWWKKSMGFWKKSAKNGDILPFVTELLPPEYAIMAGGVEITNRWIEALELKVIAEQLWHECND